MKNKQNWFRSYSSLVTSLKINQQKKDLTKWIFIVIIVLLPFSVAKPLPSFSRQTLMSCTACHVSFPELNSFGRQFKANGYTLTAASTINDQGDTLKPRTRLNLLNNLPLSIMVQTSFTNIAKDVPGHQNNSGAFPQQLSLFFAGQITPHIGSFIQMTYANGSFGMDNADIRYANTTNIGSKSLLYGVTLNNNPTSQDLWNTAPAWRFPYASSAAAPGVAKTTMIEHLGGQVAGLGVYALYNDLIFAEFSAYHTAQTSGMNPPDTTNTQVIKLFAPYWRFALQHQWDKNYVELGTFGMASTNYQTGISGDLDKFTDIGFDLQYERTMSIGTLSFHGSLISETENKENVGNYNFSSLKLDGNLYLKNGMGATVGYFNSTGTADVNIIPTGNNLPNSNGFIFQLEYTPWYNTKFAAQYVAYQKFNGISTMNDGSRNPADNNTIYLLAWLTF